MNKLCLGVLFGGRSGEHEVSLVSASSIMDALDASKYEILPIGIRKDGRWISGPDAMAELKGLPHEGRFSECVLPADPSRKTLIQFSYDGLVSLQPVDALFPVLHGTFGEDGTIQGLFEMAEIPYVGAGVMASSVGMDKVTQKMLYASTGLPVVKFRWFFTANFASQGDEIVSDIESQLAFPVFVKPSNLGSSVGISKVSDRNALHHALDLAMRFDRKVIIEQAVPNARELEVAVLGNRNPIASIPGEVVPSNEFYDYDAKYVDGASVTTIPADMPADAAKRAGELAVLAYTSIDCEGLARVDFLMNRETNELFVSEINTMPGFTSISMYPKLFEAAGISYPELLDRLIQLALDRQRETTALSRSFNPKKDWHVQTTDNA